MAIDLNQHITIEQRQELVMTPDLIQSIKILKCNLIELEDYVTEQLKENPVLEQEVPVWEIHLRNNSGEKYGPGNYKTGENDNTDYSFENYVSEKESLEEHLLMQLEVSVKSKDVLRTGEYLIESLDENGYLTVTLKSVAEVLNIELKQVKKTLGIIQTFEPYGVGARNLAECLMIQLRQVGLLDSDYIALLKYHMDDFSANRLMKISKAMKIPVEKVQQMADVLRHLEPKPGRQYSKHNDQQYIIPEIVVEEEGGTLKAVFQQNYTPQLMISSYYEAVLNEHGEDPDVMKYIKTKIESANRLIKSIEKRRQTISTVAQTIVDHQQEFFRKGDKALKPLTLKMIADKSGMHESTVSRAVNGKYLQCRMGVFELKYFLSSGLKDKREGREVSSNSIKAYIKEMIRQEDSKHPVSDQKMADMLNEKGICIARRTVAKYRESLNIPASSMRKRY